MRWGGGREEEGDGGGGGGGEHIISVSSLWSLAGGRDVRHGCNLIKIPLFVGDLPLC